MHSFILVDITEVKALKKFGFVLFFFRFDKHLLFSLKCLKIHHKPNRFLRLFLNWIFAVIEKQNKENLLYRSYYKNINHLMSCLQ